MPSLDADTILNWVTAAAVVTVASILINTYWERRKLNRSERSAAYAKFLHAFSLRWRAFGDRDGAKSAGDVDALNNAEGRVNATREDLYEAYTQIQVLASQSVIESALACVRLSDNRNRAFKSPDKYKGVGADARSAALAEFVKEARRDLGLRAIDIERLKAPPEK